MLEEANCIRSKLIVFSIRHHIQNVCETHLHSSVVYSGCVTYFLRRYADHEAYDSAASVAKVENAWSFTSIFFLHKMQLSKGIIM
jgi:hypothetical protein